MIPTPRPAPRAVMERRELRWLLLIPAVFLFTLAGVAAAQGLPIPPVTVWFASTAAWGVVTSFLVSTVRENLAPNLKGAGNIALVFGISIGGALIANTGVLAAAGVTLEGSIVDALTFGVIAGGIALGWWDGITALMDQRAKAQARATTALGLTPHTPTPAAAGSVISPGGVSEFIIGQIRARFGSDVPPVAFAILETLAAEFAGRALTPEVEQAIQRRILDLLAAAGHPGKDL